MPPRKKRRLDEIVHEVSGVDSLQRARALIMAGKVKVDGSVVSTAGSSVSPDQTVEVDTERPYVGRGAHKLLSALERFSITVHGAVCADVGSSTGGFTDVLLRQGAKRVYCVDSAKGELDWGIRNDERTVVMEGTPVQRIEDLAEPIDLCVIDVSLLSLRTVTPIVSKWLAPQGEVIALLKPQYEAREDQLPPGAVITDSKVHFDILMNVIPELCGGELSPGGLVPSKITGGSGNQEFLLWLRSAPLGESVEKLVQRAIAQIQTRLE